MTKLTPSQTIGPFFAYGLTPEQYGYNFTDITSGDLVDGATDKNKICIVGRILDGDGVAVDDAMVEIWQANSDGSYPKHTSNSEFSGFGRFGTGTDKQNRFIFTTIMPGSVGENQAPHINFTIFARGMLNHQFTRLYFDEKTHENMHDPVLNSVPIDRRHTLIARREANNTYLFDIHLQGENETVFLDI